MNLNELIHKNDEIPRFLETTYNLSPELFLKLNKHNFRLKSDLAQVSDDELVTLYGFSQEEVEKINRVVKKENESTFRPVSEFDSNLSISTGCIKLDNVFGGKGLLTGRLTQIYGEAGCGKSQICMQLCFHVQLDESNGGLNAEALYLDTEDAFRSERIQEIASNYFHKAFLDDHLINFKLQEVLARIHVRKINTNADDLVAIILDGQLESFFDCNSSIKLLIIDSIAYHFRYDYQHDSTMRAHQLSSIASKLKQISYERNIAILFTNQVSLTSEIPALGPIWNSVCSTVLHLSRCQEYDIDKVGDQVNVNKLQTVTLKTTVRRCSIVKSLTFPDFYEFNYTINENGIQEFTV